MSGRLENRLCLAALAAALLWSFPAGGTIRALAAERQGTPDLSGRSGPVYVIPVTGTIDLGLASFVRRAVGEAQERGAAAIIVRINTFGGRVDAATEIRDILIGSNIYTAALILERAWSAGALIALAADGIWMAPGATMGAAEPRPADEKAISALRAEFEGIAQRTGRDPRIAAAMVDADVEIPGLSERGKILTLTAEDALRLGYAEGIARSVGDVLNDLGLAHSRVDEKAPNWGERVARFLTDPVVSQMLLALGFIGLWAEVSSPGLGVPGIAGLIALALFFGARVFTGMVGWEIPALFALGFLLLVIELFVAPGFGIAGAAGVIAIITSIVLSFATTESGVLAVSIAVLISGAGTWILWKTGRRLGVWNRLILTARQTREEGYAAPVDFSRYLGEVGVAVTDLRPAGFIQIGEDRIDAVSEGGFIEATQRVRVVQVEGTRVVVRPE